jgi:trehalose 6-phosphate phosphatase
MTDLLGEDGRLELRRLAGSRALLAFDFDGTLAPITPFSDRAAMRPRTRHLLAEVARTWPCAVISGRRLSDLRPRFDGIPVRWFVGNHGAEGAGPVPGAARMRRSVVLWRERLLAGLAGLPGVWVEDKGMALAVHYRGSPRRALARRAILGLAGTFDGARVAPGKCVVDVLPASAPDKGAALAHLVEVLSPERVLFAGDDVTDEDAFARDLGVPTTTVRVGGVGPSRARYRIAGQGAIDGLLGALLEEGARLSSGPGAASPSR